MRGVDRVVSGLSAAFARVGSCSHLFVDTCLCRCHAHFSLNSRPCTHGTFPCSLSMLACLQSYLTRANRNFQKLLTRIDCSPKRTSLTLPQSQSTGVSPARSPIQPLAPPHRAAPLSGAIPAASSGPSITTSASSTDFTEFLKVSLGIK